MDDASSSDDSVECLKLFLGGIDPGDIQSAAESETPEKAHQGVDSATRTTTLTATSKPNRTKESSQSLNDLTQIDNEGDWETIFSLAHRDSNRRPPVRVVEIPGRGNGLIATSLIRKGDVLFTERAAFASQTNVVPACQKCFRSLAKPPEAFPLLERWNCVESRRCDRCRALFCSFSCQQHEDCCAFRPKREACTPAIHLALKMFHTLLQKHRSTGSVIDWTRGLCGTSDDCSELDMGDVASHYNAIAERWDMTTNERDVLSLECFQRLVAAACRNSFGVRTQSPFKPYYAAVLRQCGRDSTVHQQLRQAISQFLGASSIRDETTLRRGMDRDMDDHFAPEIVCLFPLISRINHSCDPNAQVVSQTFVDYFVDIVAVKDIHIGDEVFISYLPPMKRKERRKQFLKARFLFDCKCSACA